MKSCHAYPELDEVRRALARAHSTRATAIVHVAASRVARSSLGAEERAFEQAGRSEFLRHAPHHAPSAVRATAGRHHAVDFATRVCRRKSAPVSMPSACILAAVFWPSTISARLELGTTISRVVETTGPVQADRERKSSGSETTFSEDLIDPVQIEAGAIAMADDVWAWCEKTNVRG